MANKFTDIDINFTNHPITGDIVKVSEEQSIVQSVKNLILSSFYQRMFHPEIGCQVHGLLFENMSPVVASMIGNSIRNVLLNFEDRVDIVELDVTADDANNGYTVSLTIKVNNTIDPLNVSFFLTRTR